ncbi:hypothetical protein [Alteromonas gilva]|uniref:Uncharacterized protein n=1 Tax=Alteromonas gilva TaxID=2987522 RepID=A0ABT5L494_9ALTE|nr:hypothetical protein [Alteromonas gilva]MDC8831855.1 hypothetical protein [Alteromonas gilva]
MKLNINYPIPNWLSDRFFNPVRDHLSCCKLIFEVLNFVYVADDANIDKDRVNSFLRIEVSQIKRFFFSLEDKLFSISFPFRVEEKGNRITFYSGITGLPINLELVSDCLSVLHSVKNDFSLEVLVDSLTEPDILPETWNVIKEVIFFETGYIRYDHDPDPARLCEYNHPLNHLDIFYSNSATFKLGLYERHDAETFSSILDRGTNCHYLVTYSK